MAGGTGVGADDDVIFWFRHGFSFDGLGRYRLTVVSLRRI